MYLRTVLLSLFLAFSSFSSLFALHFYGGTWHYECLGGCNYRIWWTIYTDCASVGPTVEPNDGSITWVGNGANCTDPVRVGQWISQNTVDITPVCPSAQTACASPAGVFGFWQEKVYGDFDFCNVNCSSYELQWGVCCRYVANTNFDWNDSDNGFTTFHSLVIDTTLTPCNNSPVALTEHATIAIDSSDIHRNIAAFDPDGDSLSYHLGPCFDLSSTDSTTYQAGFSGQQPFGTAYATTLDPVSGDLDLIWQHSPSINFFWFCYEIHEWRNGLQIGTYRHEFPFLIWPKQDPDNFPPTVSSIDVLQGGRADGMDIYACLGSELEFDMIVTEASAADTNWFWLLDTLAGLRICNAADTSQIDTIIGWNPVVRGKYSASTPGTFSFVYHVEDNACPYKGFERRRVRIHVSGPSAPPVISNSNDSLSSSYAFGYQWYMDSLAIPGADSQQHFASQAGIYYVEVIDSSGCIQTSDTIRVEPVAIEPSIRQEMRVFPVPSSGRIRVEGLEPGKEIHLFDLQGRLIFSEKAGSEKMDLDLGKWPRGQYILRSGPQSIRVLLR